MNFIFLIFLNVYLSDKDEQTMIENSERITFMSFCTCSLVIAATIAQVYSIRHLFRGIDNSKEGGIWKLVLLLDN